MCPCLRKIIPRAAFRVLSLSHFCVLDLCLPSLFVFVCALCPFVCFSSFSSLICVSSRLASLTPLTHQNNSTLGLLPSESHSKTQRPIWCCLRITITYISHHIQPLAPYVLFPTIHPHTDTAHTPLWPASETHKTHKGLADTHRSRTITVGL